MTESKRTFSPDTGLPAPVAKVLVALCAVFMAIALTAGGYLVSNLARIRQLRVQLLATTELQERLLSRNPLDNCLFPHRIPAIGYVLNPNMRTGTAWSHPDTPYRINSIGLRGAEIGPKKPGATRVVLLGDSWFFGVGLEDTDRLQSKMQTILDTRIGSQSYEVVTIAIPGWNVASEAAFLEAHRAVIDPDVILWEICPNDAEDLGGVAPPGSLALFLSAQSRDPCAFTRIKQVGTPTPFILERFRRALATMEEVRDRIQIPWLITPVDIPPPMMGLIQQDHVIEAPLYFIPPEYRTHLKYRIKVSDSHPSARMNEIMAVAYLHRLVSLQVVPEFPLSGDESALVDRWRQYNAHGVTPEEMADYADTMSKAVPERYPSTTGFDDVAAGLIDGDKMASCGVAFLRSRPTSATVRLEVESVPQIPEPRRLTVSIRSPGHPPIEATRALAAGETVIRIPMSPSPAPSEVVEVHWSFDSVTCSTPTVCYGARLIRLDTLDGSI